MVCVLVCRLGYGCVWYVYWCVGWGMEMCDILVCRLGYGDVWYVYWCVGWGMGCVVCLLRLGYRVWAGLCVLVCRLGYRICSM